jgi:hypothetical protein
LPKALFYDSIPIVDEIQPDNDVRGARGAVYSRIYPVRFGQSVGV